MVIGGEKNMVSICVSIRNKKGRKMGWLHTILGKSKQQNTRSRSNMGLSNIVLRADRCAYGPGHSLGRGSFTSTSQKFPGNCKLPLFHTLYISKRIHTHSLFPLL